MEIPITKYESQPAADRILFSARSGKMLRLSRYYLDLLYAGDFDPLPDRLFNILWDYEILVPADEDELSVLAHLQALEERDSAEYSITLFV